MNFWDKTIRFLLGMGCFALSWLCDGCWVWIVGVFLTATAVYGCPLYRFLPCKNKEGSACPIKKMFGKKE